MYAQPHGILIDQKSLTTSQMLSTPEETRYVWKMMLANDDREREFVKSKSATIEYGKGKIINGSSGSCLGFFFVISGTMRVYMISDEGKEATLFRIGSGESCVLSASCAIEQITFDTQMVAEEDLRLFVIRAGDFAKLTDRNVHARCFMFETLTKRFSMVMEAMQKMMFERVERRISSYLMEECGKSGTSEVFSTQEEIAQRINSAREVVARTLKRFERAGLVETKRGIVRILDMEGMKRI